MRWATQYRSGIAPVLLLLGAGCSERPKPPAHSAFARGHDFPQDFETAAKQSGARVLGFGGAGDRNHGNGESTWKGEPIYCARPDQVDELMRRFHAEIVKRVRDSGGEVRSEPPPAGATPVREWRIVYSDGPQEGIIQATRNNGLAGQCQEQGQLKYQIELAFKETPETSR